RQRGVRAPMIEAGLTKQEIRDLSRALGLPTWDKPSFACLSSRFQYGDRITAEKLRKIDAAEAFMRSLGFRQFRVRHHDRLARLGDLPYADLGFAKVDLHRALRAGGAEAIFCPGKTPAQVVAILQRLLVDHVNVIATRADEAMVAAVAGAGLPHVWHPLARL